MRRLRGRGGLRMVTDPTPTDPPAPASPGERRTSRRHSVDTSVVIHLVKMASKLKGQILDLSLGGCRIRTEQRFLVGIYTRVETEFRVQGVPVLLAGVIQAIYAHNQLGIRFLDVSRRKHDQLVELIEELGEAAAQQEKQA